MTASERGAAVGRLALVTGASRGIGAAIARRLAASGFEVAVNYRARRDAALEVVHHIEAAGGQAFPVEFDVADAAQTSAALEQLTRERVVSVLVNNAGITSDAAFPAMTLGAWQSVLRTTLDGFFNVTQPLVMPMARQRFGRIVNVSSVAGLRGNRGQVNYSAAKAGLIGATKALAQEVAKRGVTVNAIAPGLIDTEMVQGAPLAELLAHVPVRRLGTPEEVAELVAYLVSDAAGYLTGQVISLDGGLG